MSDNIDNELEENKKSERLTLAVSDPKEYIKSLRRGMKLLVSKPKFNIGDIIIWEEGMANKSIPDHDSLVIVLGFLNPPRRDEENGIGSPYYNELLDIEIGILANDSTFLVYATDSKRFKLYELQD